MLSWLAAMVLHGSWVTGARRRVMGSLRTLKGLGRTTAGCRPPGVCASSMQILWQIFYVNLHEAARLMQPAMASPPDGAPRSRRAGRTGAARAPGGSLLGTEERLPSLAQSC